MDGNGQLFAGESPVDIEGLKEHLRRRFAAVPPLNNRRTVASVPIHTVAYVPDGGEQFLQTVASQNNGTYKRIRLEPR